MRLPQLHPLVWLAAIAGAVLLLAGATAMSATLATVDTAAVRSVHVGVVEPAVTDWILTVTALGGSDVVLVVTAVACVGLAVLRHWHGALVLGLSVLVTQAAVDLGKSLVSRPRPSGEYAVAEPSGFSFPSGHSATAVALYLTLALIAAGAVRGRARAAVVATGTVVALAVGLSRVYLGVHYPTDVLAGWLTGAAVVLSCWALARPLRRRGRGPYAPHARREPSLSA